MDHTHKIKLQTLPNKIINIFKQDTDPESSEAIRNLVLLVASLSFCGHTELPPASVAATSSLYQLPDFEMPLPENRGSTVRNLQAFQVNFLLTVMFCEISKFNFKLIITFPGSPISVLEVSIYLSRWNHS